MVWHDHSVLHAPLNNIPVHFCCEESLLSRTKVVRLCVRVTNADTCAWKCLCASLNLPPASITNLTSFCCCAPLVLILLLESVVFNANNLQIFHWNMLPNSSSTYLSAYCFMEYWFPAKVVHLDVTDVFQLPQLTLIWSPSLCLVHYIVNKVHYETLVSICHTCTTITFTGAFHTFLKVYTCFPCYHIFDPKK